MTLGIEQERRRRGIGQGARTSSFHVSTPEQQSDWLRRAYRQSVNPDTWETAKQVDAKTEALLRAMPEKAAGRYFLGPDDNFYVIGPDQREQRDVTEHKLSAVKPWLDTLQKKQQTTWQDLAELPDDSPLPGESEQIAKWLGTHDGLAEKTEPVQIAKALVTSFKPVIIDAPVVELTPQPMSAGGGRSGAVGGTTTSSGGLPPAPKPTTRQGDAFVTLQASQGSDPLSWLGSSDDAFVSPPVLNFNTPKRRPYSAMPSVLDLDQVRPMLGLTDDEIKVGSWLKLDQALRAQDTYSPYQNTTPMRLQPYRSHGRSPLAAAQETLDAAHETHLAKGRDWNQELPGHPEAGRAEFENALDATLQEATSAWTARKDAEPTALEVEEMRQYIAPRLVGYFPEEMREGLLKRDTPSANLPEIKNGAQGIAEFMTALTLGEIKEITVDGQKIDLAEINTKADANPVVKKKRPGSHGSLVVQRFNYLVGQEVEQFLEECAEIEAKVVNGPRTQLKDGSGFEDFTENTLQDPGRPGVKGSMRSDIAIRLVYNGQDCIFHVNSVDMEDAFTPTTREAANFNRGVENAKAIFEAFEAAKDRWEDRVTNMTLSQRNALVMIPKPANDDEAAFQEALKDFIKRLDCASILAACEKAGGYLDTLPIPNGAMP